MEKIRNKLRKYKRYWKSINGHKSLVRAFIKELRTILVFNKNLELHFHKNTNDQLEAIHLKNLIFIAKISKTVTNNDCHTRRLPSAFGSENIKIYFKSKKELKSRLVAFLKSDEHFLFFHSFSFWLYKKLFSAAKWSKKVISRNELKSLLGALTQKLWAFSGFYRRKEQSMNCQWSRQYEKPLYFIRGPVTTLNKHAPKAQVVRLVGWVVIKRFLRFFIII